MIRIHDIRVVLVRVVLSYGLDTVVLKVDIICIGFISIRVNLVRQFKIHIRLSMEATLV